ncbi:hypothetical protein AAF712_016190 [Marasmius tenuissimus]|uniref:Uncharacterized protein n=1 Tax=Marasmius tenuissimus TaxID=585030 RepID=A0ABR2Z6B8_9AGAR
MPPQRLVRPSARVGTFYTPPSCYDNRRFYSSPEPEPEAPKLTKAEVQAREQFEKWSNAVLGGTTPACGPRAAYYNIGSRWMRFVDPWTDKIELVLRFGFAEDLRPIPSNNNDADVDMEEDDEETEEEKQRRLEILDLFTLPDDMKETDKDRYRQSFLLFKTGHPTQYNQLIACFEFEAAETIKTLYSSIERGFKDARRNDTCRMKQNILSYIPNNPQQKAVKDDALVPFIDSSVKSNRGLAHDMIIPLLCPIERIKEVVHKPVDNPARAQLLDDAKAKKIQLTPTQFPGFLYDYSRINMDRAKEGRAAVFRGYLIPRASRALLTSPSSALGKKGSTRAGNAKKAGVTDMTIRFLAYVVTQIWLSLSDGETWGETVGSFNLKTFYYTMVAALEGMNHLRRDLAFAYLNEEIWGEKQTSEAVPADSEVGKAISMWSLEDDEEVEAEEAAQQERSASENVPASGEGPAGGNIVAPGSASTDGNSSTRDNAPVGAGSIIT